MSSLDFLHNVSNDELEILADMLRDKGGITSILNEKNYYSNKSEYVDKIINELLDYGSNTFWFQKSYNTILEDVCDKMDVDYYSADSEEEKENKLLGKVSSDLWNEMSDEGRRALLESMNESANVVRSGTPSIFAAIFRAGGFKSYQLSLTVANAFAKFVLGRGLSLGLNAALARALSFLSGPLGILMTVWTGIQFAGPAYRVTVPAVTYIAALRRIKKG